MLIAVDIETIVEPGKGISQSEIEAWHENYVPKEEYKKQETIDKHREADLEKWIKRQTLKAGRLRIIAMGLGRVHPFNFELQDVECLVSSNSKDICRAFGIEHDDDELELLDGSDIQKL